MPRPKAEAWAGLVFALLVLATLAAFAWSQRVKRDPLVLDRVTFVAAPVLHPKHPVHGFTPNGDCRYDAMRIRFRTTQTDHGKVQVIKPGGKLVTTLARHAYLKRYTFHTYLWAGHTFNGGIAPPGRYKLRIKLLDQDRVLVPPGSMRLHRAGRNPPPRCRPGARIGNVGSRP
ncbi:MAG TPA: hypothetical protein VNS60_12160 [Solirubrobacterales bacterium]|nr:hypothetical protein [Solirubrobacterales bacterium]